MRKDKSQEQKKIKKVLDKQKKMCYNYLVRNKETNKKSQRKRCLK